MTRWAFAAASVRGISHVKRNTRIQDAKRCFEIIVPDAQPIFCAVVSDGAGSASHGGEGASLVCRTVAVALWDQLTSDPSRFPVEDDAWNWVDDIRDKIAVAASRRNLASRDFAATMIVSVSDGTRTFTAHIGDGAIVGRHAVDQDWRLLSASENGEYASTTFFITDPGTPRLRTSIVEHPIDAIFLFSDGIENQVLDTATGEPYVNFFNPMVRPFTASANVGRDHHLSDRLAAYLDSEKFAEHTDDDKTLVIAVKK
ncbi:PP2C family serine/threonine-protein phosphatase [Neorhizobium sp. T6_25]|uniref:PP2C family serine/threonine-protein phosphatase n=1 Tax=Neorhizobium sp. T6_25 TaxID=2093833 RepID=UPI000CF9B317|nr:PP2C family serine/threonine-protein phosphatase [Neorhizobium sp. T6_25]